ncbi:MAG: type III-B CRISPR module-associated Cmr3 family protein [Planctomycetota bacterium]|nr:type III-B CRISPR module-associated Cmr3 family protein [Planctomycetota bacterium]
MLEGKESQFSSSQEDHKEPYGWVTRSGIQVDGESNTVKESMLFTQELLELKDKYGFYAELEVTEKVRELLENGPHQILFGGDSKTAILTVIEEFAEWEIEQGGENSDGEASRRLTSPAFFTAESPDPAASGQSRRRGS